MTSKRSKVAVLVALYACATLQFVRYYATATTFYLNLQAYLAGHERLPFQERVLPAVLIRLFYRSPLARYAAHNKGAFTSERAPLLIISLIAIVIAGIYVQRLYNSVSTTRALPFVVYPIFLFTMMWTYSIHLEANYSYPYDMLAVAFFSAGLYYIYKRSFVPLLLVVGLGTLNRETTLFLVPIFLLDSMSSTRPERVFMCFPSAPSTWVKAGLLFAAWLFVRLLLVHRYSANNASEDYVRIRENVGLLKPRLWPALLNICGYVLPLVVLFRKQIEPERYRRYLWVLPLWLIVMFCKGIIVETRVYGELCPYAALSAALIIENCAFKRTQADSRVLATTDQPL